MPYIANVQIESAVAGKKEVIAVGAGKPITVAQVGGQDEMDRLIKRGMVREDTSRPEGGTLAAKAAAQAADAPADKADGK